MSEHKHTGGRWVVRKVVDESGDYPFPNYDVLAIFDYGPQGVADAYQNPFNARLIAAAPALLEALDAVVAGYNKIKEFADMVGADSPDWYKKAQVALKQVRGEE